MWHAPFTGLITKKAILGSMKTYFKVVKTISIVYVLMKISLEANVRQKLIIEILVLLTTMSINLIVPFALLICSEYSTILTVNMIGTQATMSVLLESCVAL